MAIHQVPVISKFVWQPPVIDKDLTAPPGGESKGDRYIVGAGATGDWSGEDGGIAQYNGVDWDFFDAKEGMTVYVDDENTLYIYGGATWGRLENQVASRIFCLGLFEAGVSVVVADGAVAYTIPATMNGMNLVDVIASVHTKGITDTTDIQIRRRRAGADVDMLDTAITIGDEYFASDEAIDAANDDVNTGDQIYVDVDAIHSGTAPLGLSVALTFRLP